MFKRILITLLFLSIVYAQAQIASLSKPVFAGGLNELNFTINQYSCDNIVLTTNNGDLEKKTNCWYKYYPKDTGYTVIDVYLKKGKKLKRVDSLILSIKEPTAYFLIGQSKGGIVKRNKFITQDYVRVESYDFNCSQHYPFLIDSFFVQIVRNSSIIFEVWNHGNKLSHELKQEFENLQLDDQIIISNISGYTPFRRRLIESITVFTIGD